MSKVVQGLLGSIDSALALRDTLGANLKEVFIVTRTWSGDELGEGDQTELKVRMLPSPRVVEFTTEARLAEGAAVQQGDVLLKMISKNSYPTEGSVDCSSELPNVEKFYELSGVIYRVVKVSEKHVTWNVLLRRISQQG